MIISANTLEAKEDIIEWIAKSGAEESVDMINVWLNTHLGTRYFNSWFQVEDDEIDGFAVAGLLPMNPPKVFINYIHSESKDGRRPLLDKVGEWAKELGVKIVEVHTKANPKTFTKKYGFTLDRAILTKEV